MEKRLFQIETEDFVKKAPVETTIDDIRPGSRIYVDSYRSQSYRRAGVTRDLIIANWMRNNRRHVYDNRANIIGFKVGFPQLASAWNKMANTIQSPFYDVDDSVFNAMLGINSAIFRDMLVTSSRYLTRHQMIRLGNAMKMDKSPSRKKDFARAKNTQDMACPLNTHVQSFEINTSYAQRCFVDYDSVKELVIKGTWSRSNVPDFKYIPA